MNVLVTGGAGFIGSHLSLALLTQNHRVAVLDNLSTGKRKNLKDPIMFYEGDLRDRDFVRDVVANELPEVIYHLAAQASVQESLTNPVEDALINIIGSLNLLDYAVKYKVKKVIYASSAAVYGEPRYLPINELHPTEVLSGYAVSKVTVEHYLAIYKNLYGLDYTVLRYANVYGPGQSVGLEGGVIAMFTKHLSEGSMPMIYGDGEQTRDFIFIQDVVAANLSALTLGSGKIMNISTGIPTTVNSVYQLLKTISGRNPSPNYSFARMSDIRHSVLSNKLAGEVLRWQPSYSLEDGLSETVTHECPLPNKSTMLG